MSIWALNSLHGSYFKFPAVSFSNSLFQNDSRQHFQNEDIPDVAGFEWDSLSLGLLLLFPILQDRA